MRHHFHRCAHLRLVTVPASDLHGARRGGGVVLEELCDARKLTPCIGLVECELLSTGQKQELLVERATRMREEEGRPTALSGVPRERGAALQALREEVLGERRALVEENRRLEAEIAAAEDRELTARSGEAGDLGAAGLSVEIEPAWSALRVERLDALDRALDAMEDRTYGTCALCGGEVGLERLRRFPETHVCDACAGEAPAPAPLATRRRPRGHAPHRDAGPPSPPSTRS